MFGKSDGRPEAARPTISIPVSEPRAHKSERNERNEGTITAYLGPDTTIEGTLRFEHSVLIEGKFKGQIHSNGQLVIGENAQVEATIQSRTVTIKGTVKGTVNATERIAVLGKASVNGDLTTPSLQMDETVTFEGKCSMTRNAGHAQNPQRERERADQDSKQILEAVGAIKH
jgi:cytoskeletal protein CcmA (bactofilin family)